MIIILGEGEKIFTERELPSVEDPTKNNGSGVKLVISQKYISVIIPAVPLGGKLVNYYNLESDELIPKDCWTNSMQAKADEARLNISGTWKLWSFMILVIAFFAVTYTAVKINADGLEDDKKNFEQSLQNIKQGDLLFLEFVDELYKRQATVAKVVVVEGDLLQIQLSKERTTVVDFNFKKAKKKLSTSEDVFDENLVGIDYSTLRAGRFNFTQPASYKKYNMSNIELVEIRKE